MTPVTGLHVCSNNQALAGKRDVRCPLCAPRARVVRVWGLNHLIHHRAQLCLYLRLLNIPVPAVYFNSADEPACVFE